MSIHKFVQARQAKKRKVHEWGDALSCIREADTKGIEEEDWEESDLLAFLVGKFGFRAVETGRWVIRTFPPSDFCPKSMKENGGPIPLIVEAAVPKQEAELFLRLLSRCPNFIGSESFTENSKVSAYFLTPPEELKMSGCLKCGNKLSTHNEASRVTVFTIKGQIPATKICWRCRHCKLNYNYSQYGSEEIGYKFYSKPRPLVEATNSSYLERLVCKYQIHLA